MSARVASQIRMWGGIVGRMRTLLVVAGLLGTACEGGAPARDGETGPTAETAAPDTSGDTGEPPGPEDPRLRAIHVGATMPGQDLKANGNVGQPPLVDLQFGEAWPGAGWATRPAEDFVFQFFDHEAPKSWASVDVTLEVDRAYSILLFGTAEAPEVLVVEEHVRGIPPEAARVRWTHAAPGLEGTDLVLRDAATDAVYNGGEALSYGLTREFDEVPAEVHLWIDLDGNDLCAVGEVFEPFERTAGDFFHVLIAEDPKGELFLAGHTLSGQVRRRALAEACP